MQTSKSGQVDYLPIVLLLAAFRVAVACDIDLAVGHAEVGRWLEWERRC